MGREKPKNGPVAYNEALWRIEQCRTHGGTTLNLSEMGLETLPPEIGRLTGLTQVLLFSNYLSVLPPEIGQLTRVTELDLQSNQIVSLPPEIGQLTALTTLWLHDNRLATLPPEIGQLTALTTLELSGNRLTTLPPEIGQLAALTQLGLNNNAFTTLPLEIARFTALNVLGLSGNKLTTLPPEIGQLRALAKLHLDKNRLTALPPEIGQLTALTQLNLAGNQLTKLPPEIGQLTALTHLFLSNIKLGLLQSQINQLRTLTGRTVSDNQLATLPPEIGRLTALTELNLHGNQLTTLPPEIGKLTKLMDFNVASNPLTALPPEIGHLTALTELHLFDDQLTSLPPEIGQLTKLQHLYLYGNQLTTLPPETSRLTALTVLDLHNNPGLGLPAEVLGPTWQDVFEGKAKPKPPREILEYFFASLGNRGEPLREMKVLVVGRGGVGKTSVIRRLKGLPLDSQQSETHGIGIERLRLPCAGGSVSARVWDFGGQHVLHAMHEFFFTGRSLYVVVLGEREDMAERDAEYWLQLIRSYAGAAPVIVVLNKSGGRARELELPRRKLEDTYGPILAWVATECSEADLEKGGIGALERELTRVVGGMPEIQARFPKKWMQIKDWLSRMKESYMEYAAYATRCATLGETDPRKQEELAAFLHDLGVALNYRRDPRLHETTVLRPDWLADGIYALLRANDTRHPHPLAPDGRMTLGRMPAIYAAAEQLKMLKADDYPAAKHPFLLRLMAAFQLSFPLDEAGTEHLVPALLPVEEPAGSPSRLLDRTEVELRWEFPVVPAPLLPRLLVRTIGLILNQWRWRRGAIYAYGPAVARVWEEKERYIYLSAAPRNEAQPKVPLAEKEHSKLKLTIGGLPVEVDVVGTREAGEVDRGKFVVKEALADLVRIVRGTLWEIVSEYKNLKVQEQVRWQGDWLPRRAAESLGVCDPDETQEDVNREERP